MMELLHNNSDRLEQPRKAERSINVTPLPIYAVISLLQPSKAFSLILDTPSGMLTEVRSVQLIDCFEELLHEVKVIMHPINAVDR